MSYGIIHSTLIIVDHVNCWMCINLWQSYYLSAKIQRYPVDFTFIKICDRVTGQHDIQWKILSRQIAILAGHCPLTGRYFQPCNIKSVGAMIVRITVDPLLAESQNIASFDVRTKKSFPHSDF